MDLTNVSGNDTQAHCELLYKDFIVPDNGKFFKYILEHLRAFIFLVKF